MLNQIHLFQGIKATMGGSQLLLLMVYIQAGLMDFSLGGRGDFSSVARDRW